MVKFLIDFHQHSVNHFFCLALIFHFLEHVSGEDERHPEELGVEVVRVGQVEEQVGDYVLAHEGRLDNPGRKTRFQEDGQHDSVVYVAYVFFWLVVVLQVVLKCRYLEQLEVRALKVGLVLLQHGGFVHDAGEGHLVATVLRVRKRLDHFVERRRGAFTAGSRAISTIRLGAHSAFSLTRKLGPV